MSSEVENNKEKALVDPLSEVTRKERRMLLGLSMLGVFFAKTGIVPSKISTLGIELAATEQSSFFYVLAAMLVYYEGASPEKYQVSRAPLPDKASTR